MRATRATSVASIAAMPAVVALVLLSYGLAFPEAEDPFPTRVGPTAPIAGAGIGGVLATIIFILASASKREQAIRWGILIGFVSGGALYLLALIAPLG